MKAILLSIRSYWCELISRGQKTVEVRKTNPKAVQVPFKCYIYRTKTPHMAGAVIGEFTCDKIWELAPICHAPDDVEEQACMDRDYIADYLRCKGYGWHISDLKIWDEPVRLKNFWGMKPCRHSGDCCTCPQWDNLKGNCYASRYISRPPQSWCYMEDGE